MADNKEFQPALRIDLDACTGCTHCMMECPTGAIRIEGGKALREQLELDSMDFLDIVMELRKRHKIEVPEADYPQLATLDSTVAYIVGRQK